MRLSKKFTTVTPFSKMLALSFFVLCPIIAFYIGIYYQQQTRNGLPTILCKLSQAICTAPITTPVRDAEPTKFCGGIAGRQCDTGYTCRLTGNYPDAGGTCIKKEPRQSYKGTLYCTMEMKLCPDGSSVGRSGPNCAFKACPNHVK